MSCSYIVIGAKLLMYKEHTSYSPSEINYIQFPNRKAFPYGAVSNLNLGYAEHWVLICQYRQIDISSYCESITKIVQVPSKLCRQYRSGWYLLLLIGTEKAGQVRLCTHQKHPPTDQQTFDNKQNAQGSLQLLHSLNSHIAQVGHKQTTSSHFLPSRFMSCTLTLRNH